MRITLELALKTIRELEPILAEIGYHSALTGGVLFRGESEKDIDIILYPHDPNVTCSDTIIQVALSGAGFTDRYETDTKYVNRRVWICAKDGIRYDFFLS